LNTAAPRPTAVTAAPDQPSAISCCSLTRYYGSTRGVEGVDLEVPTGTVVGFLGANGAGKTTVIRMLAGLSRPTSGRALLFGADAWSPSARRRLGFMPADPSFLPQLTGVDNLDLLAELGQWECPDREWACDLLDLSAAALDRQVGGYSSGMIQKLGLVQAVQHAPDVVVLDEPANRLDPVAHHRFEELVRTIAGRSRTVLLSSHTLSEVEAVCDTIAMLRDGQLVSYGPTAELLQNANRIVTVRYRTEPSTAPPTLLGVEIDGTSVRGHLPRGDLAALRALLDDPEVVDLLVEPASLEDVFLGQYERDR
jgi:ABC-2 type transport system ATP-binding protein